LLFFSYVLALQTKIVSKASARRHFFEERYFADQTLRHAQDKPAGVVRKINYG
jgi:hypothetical protein